MTSSRRGQDSLDRHIHSRHVEGLKHYLGHLFTVSFRVQGGFCEQGRVLLRGYTELIVESVVPDLFHIIPVGDDAMFNGIFQSKDTSFALSFITHIGIFLTHTNHNTLREENIEKYYLRKITSQSPNSCTTDNHAIFKKGHNTEKLFRKRN
ncbi:hypothetical protein llap_180 [Limosa lapponica baueri]|uniref:Uncharacterized protein n=1 Tax=Limosa lapponica baueri TaxID=1758121 RepID=A0A2I0UTT7_LIMLA|nr:hypothetical protein llap_180 [Limosa lapponica baueri]